MTVPEFTGFTAETLGFLSELKANNGRDWFSAHKKTYEQAVKKPAQAFADIMAGELERLTGTPQKSKIFRINRDVRFSKDKTPYNTHIHMSWTATDAGDGAPAWMFGLSTEYCTLGCGVFEFPGPVLEKYRRIIAGHGGVELDGIIGGLVKSGYRLQDPALKRVPAGFPQDNPYASYALHKGIGVWRDFEAPQAATEPGMPGRCMECFADLLPLWSFLTGLA